MFLGPETQFPGNQLSLKTLSFTRFKTKDILHVMKLLGHKSINSTLLYTQLVNFEGDEYDVKVAETKEKITELFKVGFEWVGQDNDGLTYFKKRK